MVKTNTTDSQQRKLMKSFFSLRNSIDELREIPASLLATTSIQELYDLLIQVIDLVLYTRKNTDQTVFKNRNPGLREIRGPTTFDNVGGLITVKYPNPAIIGSETEITQLWALQSYVINMKRNLLNLANWPPKLPDFVDYTYYVDRYVVKHPKEFKGKTFEYIIHRYLRNREESKKIPIEKFVFERKRSKRKFRWKNPRD